MFPQGEFRENTDLRELASKREDDPYPGSSVPDSQESLVVGHATTDTDTRFKLRFERTSASGALRPERSEHILSR